MQVRHFRIASWLLAAALGFQCSLQTTFAQDADASADAKATEESPLVDAEKMIADGKLAEAAKVLMAFDSDKPQELSRKSVLLRSLATKAMAAGKFDLAMEIQDKLIADAKDSFAKNPKSAMALQSQLMMGFSVKMRATDMAKAADWLKSEYDELTAKANDENVDAVLVARSGMAPALKVYLERSGKEDEASKLVSSLVEEVRGKLGSLEGDEKISMMASYVNLMLSDITDEAVKETEESAKKVDDFLSEIDSAGDLKTSPALLGTAVRARLALGSAYSRVNAEKAVAMLDSASALLDAADLSAPGIENIVAGNRRNLDRAKSSIEAELKRTKLIGQPAFALDLGTIVNGEPITDDDLKGKVVLLDFWAVWCGPCIATFPHLREWQEEFADQGLVILGMTRNYGYEWDEDAKRGKRGQDVTPEAELEMLKKFAAHHELKHRFVVTGEGSTIQSEYGVTGIPQAVLIDRDGVVRMIKVGSGEANATALDEMIKELLATPAK